MSLIFCPLRGLGRHFSNSLLSSIASQSARRASLNVTLSFNRFTSTLGQSYVLVQDGIEIRELPWLVKRLNSSEIVESDSQTVSQPQPLNLDDKYLEIQFKNHLQECNSMEEVILLLEKPGEMVTPASAASALCRIGVIKSAGEHLGSFIRRAVLNELCETVLQGIKHLSSRMVLDLVKSCLRPNCYEERFLSPISSEVERRLGNSHFNIAGVCELVTVLSEHTKDPFPGMLDLCWVHLGSRFQEFDEKNLAKVYEVLRYTTSRSNHLVRIADNQLKGCCMRLTPSDVATVSKWTAFFGNKSSSAAPLVGRWLYANVHRLDPEQMRHVLGMFLHFGYVDRNVLSSLEKFIQAYAKRTERGGNRTDDRTLVHMAADYCRQGRVVSRAILDSVAYDFSTCPSLYGLVEGQSVLKTFGQLNYVPGNGDAFFGAAESWLLENHERLGLVEIFELLASFVYIQKYPINFIDRVFSARLLEFYADSLDQDTRAKAANYLLEIQASYMVEFPWKPYLHLLPGGALQVNLPWIDNRMFKFHKEVSSCLKEIVGSGKWIDELKTPRKTPHFINFELLTDENRALTMNRANCKSRLAILLVAPQDYNSEGKPMGHLAMKLRHLEYFDYNCILVHYVDFCLKNRRPSDRADLLRQALSGHVNFDHPGSESNWD